MTGPARSACAPAAGALELCDRWWAAHAAPQAAADRGTIHRPGWRPAPAAVAVWGGTLVAIAFAGPTAARWLADDAGLGATAARWLVWELALLAVFAYVAKATTRRRGDPLRGRHGGHRDAAAVLAAGTALLLVWGDSPPVLDGQPASALRFGLPLVVGAHFSYTEKLPRGVARSIDASAWQQEGWGPRAWAALRVGLLGVAGLTLAATAPTLRPLVVVAVLVLVAVSVTLAVRPAGYGFYLHHWAAFLWLALAAAACPPVAAAAAAAFVEGASRWSCAPLWHPIVEEAAP